VGIEEICNLRIEFKVVVKIVKGQLRDGSLVAVKVLSIELDSVRGERGFVAELNTLANIKHPNLVILRGCCVEGAHRYIVYDYMENNSLRHTFLGDDLEILLFSRFLN